MLYSWSLRHLAPDWLPLVEKLVVTTTTSSTALNWFQSVHILERATKGLALWKDHNSMDVFRLIFSLVHLVF